MPIPGFEKAVIEPAKLRDYVLSEEHPVGRYKAAVFRKLGYTQGNWKELEKDIREQLLLLDPVREEPTPFGKKYEVKGKLKGPSGAAAAVVSIWLVKRGEEKPRFVTIYPQRGLHDF
jgi:hypothetical protein